MVWEERLEQGRRGPQAGQQRACGEGTQQAATLLETGQQSGTGDRQRWELAGDESGIANARQAGRQSAQQEAV